MENRTKNIIWLLVGGYLTYTGISLSMDMIQHKPEYYMMMLAFGIVFMGVGAFAVIRSLKRIFSDAPTEDKKDGSITDKENQSESEE